MNFQLIQKAIQNGWTTDVEDYEDIRIDAELTDALVSNGFKFSDIDGDEVMGWVSETKTSKEESEVMNLMIKSGSIEKKDLIKAYAEYNGADTVSDLYCLLENERSVWESDLERLSEKDLDAYLENMAEDDREYEKFLKASGLEKYVLRNIKSGKKVGGRDIVDFLEEYMDLLDLEMAKSEAFIDSLNSIEADRHSGFRTTYYKRIETVYAIFEAFNFDSELQNTYFENVWDVNEDDFEDQLFDSHMREEAKTAKREEMRNNRISVAEAREYLENNDFDAKISVGEGQIGMEDMTFDWLSINGEVQDAKPNFGRGSGAWYSGRDFGDKSMAKDWFYEKVDKHLSKKTSA